MERVVTINLNGNAYQLEEPAYDALRAYLGRAQAALAANPDKAEIIRDLEQAIADKCALHMGAGKTVVNAAEMARVLEEMGPVEGEGAPREGAPPREEDDYIPPLRRLYRIYDRHAWTGVSAGLAAYAGIDVAWVRVLWILSTLFTGGFMIIVYLVLIFAMPVASTSEEMAAAHGAPFNAQEVVERAKREYGAFAENSAKQWRREHRRWRRHWRSSTADWDWGAGQPAPVAPAQPVGYATRIAAGCLAFLFSVITAALLIAFLIAFFSLLGTGALLGWVPPVGVPLWLAIVIVCIVYAAISAPFSAMRRSSFATLGGQRDAGGGWSDGFVTLAIVAVALWLAWMFWPDARDVLEVAYDVMRNFADYVRDIFL